MAQAEELYRLQEIELSTLRIRKRLQEIAAALANEETVRAAQAQVDHARRILTPLHTHALDLDLEIKSNIEKTRAADERLYSGTVRNPKELQDLQQEIESLRKWRGELETQSLETMFLVEEAEAALSAAEADLTRIRQEWESAHGHLLDEQAELKSQLEQNRQRRERILSLITPENVQIYDSLKVKKNNQPVALMQGNTCSMCGVAQNMAVEREARQGRQLAYCTNCGRILVPRP